MKKGYKTVFNTVMTASCLLGIICAAVTLVVYCTPLYYLYMKLFDIPAESGYSAELIRRNYDVLIQYNTVWGAKTLVFPDLPMSVTGEIHFAEVKKIFVLLQWGVPFFALLTLAGSFIAKKYKEYRYLKYTVIAAGAIVVIVGAALLIDWDWCFVFMHKILFTNDYWLFDPDTDPVINILPDSVFLCDGAAIVLLVAIGLFFCAKAYKKRKA